MSAWTRLDRILSQIQAPDFSERCPILHALLAAEKLDREKRFPHCERCRKSLRVSTAEEYDGYCNEFCQTSSSEYHGKSYEPPQVKAPRAPKQPKQPHQSPNYAYYARKKSATVTA